MARFRDIKAPRKFASVHPSIHNHFNLDRQITDRDDLKQAPSAALAERRQFAARGLLLRAFADEFLLERQHPFPINFTQLHNRLGRGCLQ